MTTAHVSEVWKAAPDYEGFYEVSDLGRVRSMSRMVDGGSGMRLFPGRVRKLSTGSHGYLVVSLSRKGEVRVFCVNRLVLLTFCGSSLASNDACHNDGDKRNNALLNLRWDTRAGNAADRKIHGTHIQGSASPVSKLNEANVREIKDALSRKVGTTALAKIYGVAVETIHSIKSGKSWKHV